MTRPESSTNVVTVEAELERLRQECPVCESCGHVQGEPNWCHKCGHRVKFPDWAKELHSDRDAESEAREKAEAALEDIERRIATYWGRD